MRDLKTLGFHHITMVSRDARRTLDFYGGLLGLPLVKKTVNFDDPSAYHLYFGDGRGGPGTILTFFEWANTPKGRWGVGGVHHLALGTADATTQLKWKRRLTDHGVPVSGPYDRGYFKSIYFADPDGQILEIATRGPGYGFDEPMDALGQRRMQPAAGRLPAGRDESAIAALIHPEPVSDVTPDMRLEGIHHITAITDDLDRAHDFYTQALGLELVKKTVNQDDGKTLHYFWAAYDGSTVAPHSSITLFGWPGSDYVARGGFGQTHHVAFRADDPEQQLAWRDHLRGLGLDVSPVLDRTYFRSIYFRAPDGLLHEIATDGPGFAVDESATALGADLKLPPWLESGREHIEAALTPLVSEGTRTGRG
jgi:glyoxalase family protein